MDRPRIPVDLLPADGRFGSGPSRVRPEALAALVANGQRYLGTSHRQSPVRAQVQRLQEGIARLLGLPDGWEVLLGNGGTTAFWDAATLGLVRRRSQHLTFGEFSSKFATATATAPFLDEPDVRSAPPGRRPDPEAVAGVDAYCLTHNETSTGVMAPLVRPAGGDDDALVLVDATSAAGAVPFEVSEIDCYYFAPQKVLAADGGLWLAACSPATLERIGELRASSRWVPASLDLQIARDNSAQHQTYNTPALATILLAAEQVDWLLDQGGLSWAAARCAESSGLIHAWIDRTPGASAFVERLEDRSIVVTTVDLDGVDAAEVAATLRANGIVDTEPYRKLGRNQLRIATFPATPPSDIEALLTCVDWVTDHLT